MRSAGAMSLGTIASRILGLARDIVLASYFSRTVTDAFVVAFRLPNLFRRVLGEGSLSVSFMPIYIDRKIAEAEKGVSPETLSSEARALASGIFTLLALLTGILSAIGIIWMPQLMSVLVGGDGYNAIAGKLDTTVWLARVMFSYVFFVTLFAFYMAIANAWKKFLIPALAPALFNAIFIVFAFIPDGFAQRPAGEYLAWGVLVGGLGQMLLVAHLLWKMGLLPRLRWKPWAIPSVKRVLINMVPGVAGLGVLQIIAIVNVNLASDLPEGAHSYIYWGDRILELPQAIIAVSLGAAMLPSLSQLNAEKKFKEMLQSATDHLQFLLFLTVPCAVGLFLVAQPLSEALFMRGQFSKVDATVTAKVIQIYTILLLASSFSRVLVPSFYARKNTWLPAVVSGLTLLFHLGVAIWMTRSFGLMGLVGATTLSGIFNVLILTLCYRSMIGPLGVAQIFWASFKWIPGLVVMGLWLWGAHLLLSGFWPEAGSLIKSLKLAILVGPGAALYIFISAYFGVREARQFIQLLKRRFT